MLSKKYRLNKKEINELKAARRPVIQGRFFGLLFEPRKDERKFGLIISNKICRKATARNRVKRQLFQAIQTGLMERNGWFLFLAKKGCLEGNPEEFLKEMAEFKEKIE